MLKWITKNIGFCLLISAVITSAVAVVYARNQSRVLFLQIQETRKAHQYARTEWGQWQLELATEGNLQHILQIAQTRLGMHIPQSNQHLTIDP